MKTPQACEYLENCGFFKKHGESKVFACKGILLEYCKGPKRDACMRKEYRKTHGSPPDDDMMPTGRMIVS